MLTDAIRQAKKGRAVYVIAADRKQKMYLEHHLKLLEIEELGIKVETPDSCANFDWDRLWLLGAHPNCVVLVDHYAIERRFERLLEMLHRYD